MALDVLLREVRHTTCQPQVVKALVGKDDVGVQGQAANLAEQHLGERQSVLCLQQGRLRLIELHFDRQLVGLGGHTRRHHLPHVVVEVAKRLGITLG